MKQHFQLEEINHFIPLVFHPISNSESFVHFSYCGNIFLVTLQLTFRKAYFQVFGYNLSFTLSKIFRIVFNLLSEN